MVAFFWYNVNIQQNIEKLEEIEMAELACRQIFGLKNHCEYFNLFEFQIILTHKICVVLSKGPLISQMYRAFYEMIFDISSPIKLS